MHCFDIGRTRVHHIEEWQGPFSSPGELFSGFDVEDFSRFRDTLPDSMYLQDSDMIYAFLQSWVIERDGLTLLFDTGAGNDKSRPGIPVFGNLQTNFLERLHDAGFTPGDIDVVVNSHLHIDHVGWNTRLEGQRWVPTFPNARYLFSETDRNYWDPSGSGPRPTPVGSEVNRNVFQDSVQPILDSGQGETVTDDYEICPGMILYQFPGHTPGHLVLEITDGEELAMFVGDILHHPAQIHRPEWNSVYCEDPAQARETRRRVLERAANSGARVVPAHFGGAHFAWVERDGDHFRPRYS